MPSVPLSLTTVKSSKVSLLLVLPAATTSPASIAMASAGHHRGGAVDNAPPKLHSVDSGKFNYDEVVARAAILDKSSGQTSVHPL